MLTTEQLIPQTVDVITWKEQGATSLLHGAPSSKLKITDALEGAPGLVQAATSALHGAYCLVHGTRCSVYGITSTRLVGPFPGYFADLGSGKPVTRRYLMF